MLKFTQVKQINEDGVGEFKCSPDELSFLVTYAINTLVAKGLAEVDEKDEEPNDVWGN